MTGTIKRFFEDRGFGFIEPDDGGRDLFVHISAVENFEGKNLSEGQRVEYDEERGPKGLRAVRVQLL